MHISIGMRGRTNPNHNGAADRVREALAARGPMSRYAIEYYSGLSPQQTASAIQFLLSKAFQIGTFTTATGKRRYALAKDMPVTRCGRAAPATPYAVAGRITIGRGAKWGAGLV